MKTLEELKEMRKNWLDARKSSEYYEEFKKYNFVAYSCNYDDVKLTKTYAEAKSYAEEGGQILSLNNDKIYTYKVKIEDEYMKYLENQIKYENQRAMNSYGL